MRCPNCGGLNPDTASYCVRCGRDFVPQKPQAQRPTPPAATNPNPRTSASQQPPAYRPAPPVQRLNGLPPTPPYTQPQAYPQPRPPAYPQQGQQTPQRPSQPAPPQPSTVPPRPPRQRVRGPIVETPLPEQPAEPAAPSPFPPKNMEQLRALASSAFPFSLISDGKSFGKKRLVRIAYPTCTGWQQVATLFAALKQFDAPQFDTIVIQGVHEHDREAYLFTNGQLTFDRNTRLGNQVLTRYQIETDNGYASSSVRIVLTE
jgi:hypothetical protein